jgi:hypothetical protein
MNKLLVGKPEEEGNSCRVGVITGESPDRDLRKQEMHDVDWTQLDLCSSQWQGL